MDVLVLDTRYDQERIKRMITGANPCFYLVNARTIGADYKVLWYHPHGRGTIRNERSSTRRPLSVKVDILLPGIMDLPSFDPRWIDYENDLRLPTAPLSLVLLHKVRGWWERVNSPEDHHYQKHMQDADDVATLAPLASEMGVTIDDDALPDDFIESASGWVNNFIVAYPEFQTGYHWRQIGFETYAEL